jgi:hypothetical protein
LRTRLANPDLPAGCLLTAPAGTPPLWMPSFIIDFGRLPRLAVAVPARYA